MTVVKWDLEILMPFPSIMPSLCCRKYRFNLESHTEHTVENLTEHYNVEKDKTFATQELIF